MSVQALASYNVRLLVGAVVTTIGAAALYNRMWFTEVFPPDASALMYQAWIWMWPTSVIVTLIGLMILPPGRGRYVSWGCFVLFVLATGIHAIVRDLYFDDYMLWW